MMTFWARVKNIIFMLKLLCRFLDYFWKKLGYFLYQHLVTLASCKLQKCKNNLSFLQISCYCFKFHFFD